MKTLFFKSNIPHIRTNEGEFEVSNPEVVHTSPLVQFHRKWNEGDEVEWPYCVELIVSTEGVSTKAVARLLPKEEFKPAQPTPNFPKGGTTFTESAYICPIDNKPCYMSNCIHSDEYPALCGNKKERSESAYKEFEGKDMENIQEYASEMPYEGSPLQLQREVEFLRTANKNLHDQLQSFWNTHVVPLQEENQRLKNDLLDALDLKEGRGPTALSMAISEIKALREELGTTEKALQEINNQHQEDYKRLKSALEEIERLKAELKNANSALDNISDMGHA